MATTTTETSKDFSARVGSIVLNTFTGFGLSLGFDLGLFDVLTKQTEPKTSQEIADACNMKERYIREWLGAMIISKIVELDSTGDKYYIPAYRVPVLRESGLSCFIPFLAEVYEKVKACFPKDGPRGVPYDAYSNFASVAKEESKDFLQNILIPSVVSGFPELKKRLDKGITAVDIGCGSGISTIEFAKAFPNSTFYGLDMHEPSLKDAKEMQQVLNLKNLHFVAGDAAKLPSDWDEKFNFVFMHDALHDQAYPDKVLNEIYRVLTPDGIYLALEPMAYTKHKDNLESKLEGMEFLYMISLMHCMPVSLYFEGGMGLGAVWGREKAVEMMTAAGLEVCTVATNSGVGQHFYCKKNKSD